MARKPAPRVAKAPAAIPAALERLSKLAAAATSPDRMAREAQRIVADWRAEPELDRAALRERLETLRDDLSDGVAAAEEQAGDVDQSDKAAAKQAAASLNGLRAVYDAVSAELA